MSAVPVPRTRRPLAAATVAVTAGRPPRLPDGPLQTPPVLSSTYHAGGPIAYGRDGNEAWTAFEDALGALEGGTALCFSSGMAAITAVFETLPVGAVVVAPEQCYAVARTFLEDRAAAGRLALRLVDIGDNNEVINALDGAVLLWAETVTNPLNVVADLPVLAAAARERQVVSACDATFSTPYVLRPLDHGFDVVVHSVTKGLSGHSDLVMGATVTAPTQPQLCEAIRQRRKFYGGIAGPLETWLALRGMRTLALRMDRAQANALDLAQRLQQHLQVERVRYPGLPADPWHGRAAGLMRNGFGAMVSFEVHGGAAAAEAVCASVRLAVHATSLGGVETTLERRRRWPGESATTPDSLIRMSVGCEHVDDLWDDLDHALKIASAI